MSNGMNRKIVKFFHHISIDKKRIHNDLKTMNIKY